MICAEGESNNSDSLDTVCAALAYAMAIELPSSAAPKNGELSGYIDTLFDALIRAWKNLR